MEFEAPLRLRGLKALDQAEIVGIAWHRGMPEAEARRAWKIVVCQRERAGRAHPPFPDLGRFVESLRAWRVRYPVSDAPLEAMPDSREMQAFLVGVEARRGARGWRTRLKEVDQRLARFVYKIKPLDQDGLRRAVAALRLVGARTSGPEVRIAEAFLYGFGGQAKRSWESVADKLDCENDSHLRDRVRRFHEGLRALTGDATLVKLVQRVEQEMRDTRGRPRRGSGEDDQTSSRRR